MNIWYILGGLIILTCTFLAGVFFEKKNAPKIGQVITDIKKDATDIQQKL